MHGLTGGSWKRSYDQATATEKNNPTGNRAVLTAPRPTAAQTPPRQLPTLQLLSKIKLIGPLAGQSYYRNTFSGLLPSTQGFKWYTSPVGRIG
jgi:transposase